MVVATVLACEHRPPERSRSQAHNHTAACNRWRLAASLFSGPCRCERAGAAHVVPGGLDPAAAALDVGDAELVDVAVERIGDAAHVPPGPFAFANPDRVRGILERAGFGEIEITARDEQVGSGDLDSMLAVCSRVGALGKILRENPELRAATLPAVRSALAAHDEPDGIRLNAATWIVTARAPAGL